MLDTNDVLRMRVLPKGSSSLRLDGWQRPARQAAVAIELLEQCLRAGDARLGNREVGPSDDALQALRLGQQGRVLRSRRR